MVESTKITLLRSSKSCCFGAEDFEESRLEFISDSRLLDYDKLLEFTLNLFKLVRVQE